ncbi:MAG TPA: RIP metalloprotease RseP [Acidobacteriota bacterium]|nr:RIP metalloprotease RseP [Acidobacteriota bacterium]
MLDVAVNALALLFVLGVLIFVHELGHFLVAKYFGVGVEVFSLGFGKRVAGFRRGDTDYRLSLLPLGGYVKMVGENPDEELSGADNEYLGKPKWQRFLVLIAGPAMNIALAFILTVGVYQLGIRVQADSDDPVVIRLVQADSPAAEAGLQPGDRIVTVDGETMPNWEQFRTRILISANQPMNFGVIRGGAEITLPITPMASGEQGTGLIGVTAPVPPEVGPVAEDGMAAEAGLQPGDRIVGIDGVVISHWNRLVELLSSRPGEPLTLSVDRAGSRFETTLTPQLGDNDLLDVGFAPNPANFFEVRSYPLGEAMVEAGRKLRRDSLLLGEILKRLFTGRMSVKTLSGPIEIARFSGAATRTGDPSVVMSFMAFISLQLGILNLLPIPVLDGGQVALILFEGAIRRDLSLRVKERIMQVGLVMLVSLMVVVLTLDLTKAIPDSWLAWLPF